MAIDSSEQKTPAQEIYQQIYKELKINPRTIQWYATEGYIPKPEKIGAEAFYPQSAQIQDRVRVIQTLQKRFDLKLKEIKEITKAQFQRDWETINNLLTAMEELFPYIEVDDFSGDHYVSDKGSWIAKTICDKLKTTPPEEISLADEEEKYDKANHS